MILMENILVKKPKLIILCGPSGSGKSTIVKFLLEHIPHLALSVSVTTREKRESEIHSKDYFFMNEEEFLKKKNSGEFLEYEEVYPGRFYGTLKTYIDELLHQGKNVILDIDVMGAIKIKKYNKQTLSIIIKPPSLKILKERLLKRQTDTPEHLAIRLKKAHIELSYAKMFDEKIINRELNTTCMKALIMVQKFIEKEY